MTQGIYQIRNIVTGKVYVGSSAVIEKRWRRHLKDLRAGKHHAMYLQRAWAKYGSEAFEFSVLEDVSEAQSLTSAEQRWIDELCAYGQGGYNGYPTASSPLGFRHTPETRRKMSEAAKGPRGPMSEEARRNMSAAAKRKCPASEETRAKQRIAMLGKSMSPEARRKISESRKGKPLSELQRRSLLGRVVSDEQRAKQRAAILGRKHSPETIAKMSAQRKGKPKPESQKEKMRAWHKARRERLESVNAESMMD